MIWKEEPDWCLRLLMGFFVAIVGTIITYSVIDVVTYVQASRASIECEAKHMIPRRVELSSDVICIAPLPKGKDSVNETR